MLEILSVGPLLFLLLAFAVIFIAFETAKNSSKAQKKSLLVSSACLLIVTASWAFNFGVIRFTMLFVTLIITCVFVATNYIVAGCFEYSRRLKVLNVLFVLTYLFANLLYPDTDFANSYAFFGLINTIRYTHLKNEIITVLEKISEAMMLAHIGLFIWQIIEVCVMKSRLKKKAETVADEAEEKIEL